jgi:hypothetical protein
MADPAAEDHQAVTVYSPCGDFVVRFSWPTSGAAEVAVRRKAADAGDLYYAVLDEATSQKATHQSGCGGKSAAELTAMVHAALVGSSKTVEYAVVAASDVVQVKDDALLLQLTYRAEFTNAVIVVTLRRRPPSRAPLASADHAAARLRETEAALAARDEELSKVRAEKDHVTRYAKTTLQVLREEIDGLKSKLAESTDRRAVQRLKESVGEARRDAEIARTELNRALREVERLRSELRRVNGSRQPSPARATPRARSPPVPSRGSSLRSESDVSPGFDRRRGSPTPSIGSSTQRRRTPTPPSRGATYSWQSPATAPRKVNRFDTPPRDARRPVSVERQKAQVGKSRFDSPSRRPPAWQP